MISINTGFYNITIFSFPTAMSRWGSFREQLMWHLPHKLLIVFLCCLGGTGSHRWYLLYSQLLSMMCQLSQAFYMATILFRFLGDIWSTSYLTAVILTWLTVLMTKFYNFCFTDSIYNLKQSYFVFIHKKINLQMNWQITIIF